MRQQWSWMPDAQAVELSQSQFKTSQLTFFFLQTLTENIRQDDQIILKEANRWVRDKRVTPQKRGVEQTAPGQNYSAVLRKRSDPNDKPDS